MTHLVGGRAGGRGLRRGCGGRRRPRRRGARNGRERGGTPSRVLGHPRYREAGFGYFSASEAAGGAYALHPTTTTVNHPIHTMMVGSLVADLSAGLLWSIASGRRGGIISCVKHLDLSILGHFLFSVFVSQERRQYLYFTSR